MQAQQSIAGKAGPKSTDRASVDQASSPLHDNNAQPAQHQQTLNEQEEQPMQLDHAASHDHQHEQLACQADQDITKEQEQPHQDGNPQLDHAETLPVVQEQPETQQQTLATAFKDVQNWLPVHGRFWCPDINCQKSYTHRAEFAGYASLHSLHKHIRKEQQRKRPGHASMQSMGKQVSKVPTASQPADLAQATQLYADGCFWCADSNCTKSLAYKADFAGYSALDSLKRHIKKELAAGTTHLGWQEMLQQKGVKEQLALAAQELPRRRGSPSNAGQQQLAGAPSDHSHGMAASKHNHIVPQGNQSITTGNKAPSAMAKDSHAANSKDVMSSQAVLETGRSGPAASNSTPVEGQALAKADMSPSVADKCLSVAPLAMPVVSNSTPLESIDLAEPDGDVPESTPEPPGVLRDNPVDGNSNLTSSQGTPEARSSILAGNKDLLAATKTSPAAPCDGPCQGQSCSGIGDSSLALAEPRNVVVGQSLWPICCSSCIFRGIRASRLVQVIMLQQH